MAESERPNDGELILYQTQEGTVRIEVLYESETFWLNQRRRPVFDPLARALGRTKPTAQSTYIRGSVQTEARSRTNAVEPLCTATGSLFYPFGSLPVGDRAASQYCVFKWFKHISSRNELVLDSVQALRAGTIEPGGHLRFLGVADHRRSRPTAARAAILGHRTGRTCSPCPRLRFLQERKQTRWHFAQTIDSSRIKSCTTSRGGSENGQTF